MEKRNFASGVSKRIRRFANVDPVWATFVATHCNCDECGVATERATGDQETPTDRIYERKVSDDNRHEEFTPDDIRVICRSCKQIADRKRNY